MNKWKSEKNLRLDNSEISTEDMQHRIELPEESVVKGEQNKETNRKNPFTKTSKPNSKTSIVSPKHEISEGLNSQKFENKKE